MSALAQDSESTSQSTVLDTYISARDENEGILTFTLSGINVSIANGLRRTILSDIPILAFKTFPHNENQANFVTNTSRFNNEILKQRLGCIPIHIPDLKMPYNELLVEIHKKNDTNELMYVTTKDFRVKNTSSEKYLDESTVRLEKFSHQIQSREIISYLQDFDLRYLMKFLEKNLKSQPECLYIPRARMVCIILPLVALISIPPIK